MVTVTKCDDVQAKFDNREKGLQTTSVVQHRTVLWEDRKKRMRGIGGTKLDDECTLLSCERGCGAIVNSFAQASNKLFRIACSDTVRDKRIQTLLIVELGEDDLARVAVLLKDRDEFTE